jgi:hypothetical protein
VPTTETTPGIAVASAEDLFLETIDPSDSVNMSAQGTSGVTSGRSAEEDLQRSATDRILSEQTRSVALRWLLHDIPYIAMLFLVLVGVVLRLPVIYWVILTPVFAFISIIERWRKPLSQEERLGFVGRIVLDWGALLIAIFLLYSNGVQGVMNPNATSLGMMLLLGLGTFVSGVQARVWQICAIGGVLFLAVPGLGWLDRSPLLLTAAAFVIVGLSGVAWWWTSRSSENSK